MRILITGGLGFVGSHMVWAAAAAGHQLLILDDRSAGTDPILPADVEVITGCVGDVQLVSSVLDRFAPDAVVHFAGLIQVGESVQQPGRYFDVNLVRPLHMLDAVAGRVSAFVFSSTAAVYGEPSVVPIPEHSRLEPINPYGASKLAFCQALRAYHTSHGLRWAALRYFNAAGAHPDGHLVEAHDPETHLIPLAVDATLNRRNELTVFGTDYNTADGTCVRDYIHVCDLADAHLLALECMLDGELIEGMNLGTGDGISVREIIEATAHVLGKPVPHKIGDRRPGDPPALIADSSRAKDILGWRPKRSSVDMIIADTVRSRTGD
jgi:UDP-glucose-4-epimerase GalE